MGKAIEDIIYEKQCKIILDIAKKEPCVVIGRNADYILKDREDVLNVFIHGELPQKTQRICQLYHVSEKEAVKMMEDIDRRPRGFPILPKCSVVAARKMPRSAFSRAPSRILTI